MKVIAMVLSALLSTAFADSTPPPNYYCGLNGWHTGTYLQSNPRSAAPNGVEWQGYECAAACKEHGECEFWTLRMNRGKECLFLKNKGIFVEEKQNPHMEGDVDGNCLIDPPYICGYDGYHRGVQVEEPVEGEELEWYECANKCLQNDECEFWTLRMDRDKQCILKKNQGEYVEEKEHPHMEGDTLGRCIKEETYACGLDGWHRGTYLDTFPPPAGRDWTEDECAEKCRANTQCEFWTLRMNRGKECLLLKDQGGYVEAKSNPHKEGDLHGKCLTDPSYSCGYDGWHQGTRLQTLEPSESPNGLEWQGYECADACKEDDECEFWTLRLNRGKQCLFLKNKGQFVVEKHNPHMEGDEDGNCLIETTTECTATLWGDPHVITFDGLRYDAMAHGQFILLQDMDSDLEVQGRFEGAFDRIDFDPAVTTSIAIRGNEKTHPIVQLSIPSEPEADATIIRNCPVELYVNGTKEEEIFHNSIEEGGAYVMLDDHTDVIDVVYPGVLRLEITLHFWGKCHFSTVFTVYDCDEKVDSVVGLLGSPNGDWSDDWMNQDGTLRDIPSDDKGVYFGPAFDHTMEWKIDENDDVLFDAFVYFPDEEYDPTYETVITDGDPTINEICGDNIQCRVDGMTLGENGAFDFLDNPANERPDPTARTVTFGDDDDDDDALCIEEL